MTLLMEAEWDDRLHCNIERWLRNGQFSPAKVVRLSGFCIK